MTLAWAVGAHTGDETSGRLCPRPSDRTPVRVPRTPEQDPGRAYPTAGPPQAAGWPPWPARRGQVTAAASRRRTTARTVSWLTPNSAARARRLMNAVRARMATSLAAVSLQGRCWYRRWTGSSGRHRAGHRRTKAAAGRGSGTEIRRSRRSQDVAEDSEPTPGASAGKTSRSARSQRTKARTRTSGSPQLRSRDRLRRHVRREPRLAPN